MTEHKKIENLLRTAKFESNQDVNKSVLKNLLERFDRDSMKVSEPGLGRKIMQSKLSKFVAAAIVIIILYSGINFWGGNNNGVALGNVIESMQKKKWIHANGTVERNGQTLKHEDWECFDPKINIKVDPEGAISYWDFGNKVAYFYQPSTNTITISPTTDRFNQSGPESMTEIVKFMIDQFESEGGKVTRTKSTMDGVPVEIFNMVDERQDMILIVDAQKNLPLSIENIVHVPQMNLDGKSSVVIDYPEQGPIDIYSLGVPKDAKVIDNRPKGDTQNIINEIQERFDAGYGNHIAVVLESYVDDNDVLEPAKMMVMREKDGLKRLDRFNVFNYSGSKSNIPTLYSVVKDNWPELTIQDVLDLEDDKFAEYQIVFDGKTSSIRMNYSGREQFSSIGSDMFLLDGVESIIGYSSINPSAQMMTSSDREVKFEIIPVDPNHQGLVGLNFSEVMDDTSQILPAATITERNTSYWFDPEKDYLLVESTSYQIIEGRCTTFNKKVIEASQTDSGKWYPKIIISEALSPDAKDVIHRTVREIRIMVDTNPVFKEGIFEEIKDLK